MSLPPRRGRPAVILAVAVAMLSIGVVPLPAADAAEGVLHIAVDGRDGAPCTAEQPCATLDGAMNLASEGQTIWVGAGSYPVQRVSDRRGRAANFTSNVVISSAPGERASVAGLDIYAPRVTIRQISVVGGGIRLRQPAEYSRIEFVDVDGLNQSGDGPSVQMAASNSALIGSWLHDRTDRDHVFIGNGGSAVRNVEVRGNLIGPAPLTPGSGAHTDCLQIGTEAQDIRITGNVLFGCSNSAVIISAAGGPITNVLLADNIMRGCGERTATCAGYFVLYLRLRTDMPQPMDGIRVLGNTIDGATSISPEIPGLEIASNIIRQVSVCGEFEHHNVIETIAPGTKGCQQLGVGDRLAAAQFVDRERMDYRLTVDSPGVSVGGPAAFSQDLAGFPRTTPNSAGARERDKGLVDEVNGPTRGAAGSLYQLSGRLVLSPDTGNGAALAGQRVGMYTRPRSGGVLSRVLDSTTDAEGRFFFTRALTRSTVWEFRYEGDTSRAGAQSNQRLLVAVPVLRCPSVIRARAGAVTPLRCTVTPNLARTAELQVLGGNGLWRAVRRSSSHAEGGTQVVADLVRPARGTTTFRFLTATDQNAERGTGEPIRVVVP